MTTFRVPVLVTDTPTKQGYIYPKAVIEKMVESARNKKYVCPIAQPDTPYGYASMLNASHVVEGVELEGSTLYAELRTLDTDAGTQLASLQLTVTDLTFHVAGVGETVSIGNGVWEVTDFVMTGVYVNP